MITLERLQLTNGSDETIACIVLSSEEERVARKYRDLKLVEKNLLAVLEFQLPLNEPQITRFLSRVLFVINCRLYRLQRQWKDLQTGVKRVN